MTGRIDFVEFVPDGSGTIVELMADLATVEDGSAWLTLDPAVDEHFPPPVQTSLGRLVSGRGPAVPRATWVPAQTARRRPEPVSVGILHGTGADAARRLTERDLGVPPRWRVVADHSKRGLVVWVPIDIEHAVVLEWTLQATAALTRIPLTGVWRAAVHGRG